MKTHYQTLNLNPGASIEEVKASYRRLAKQYHPDVRGRSNNTGLKFHEIHEAYRSIVNKMDEGQGHITNMVWPVFDRTKRNHSAPPRREADRSSAGPAIDWRFEGVTEKGDDVVYVLRLSASAAGKGINLVLPWKAEDACPACLGRGRTFTPIFGGSNRYQTVCPKCGGKGVTRYNSTVHLDLTPDMIRQGVVRMKRLGRYLPRRAVRGDLVIELLVDQAVKGRSSGLFSA